jgi:hypothetical protein
MLDQKETREWIREGKGRIELIQSTSVDSVFKVAFPGVEGGLLLARKVRWNHPPGPLGSRPTPGDNVRRRRRLRNSDVLNTLACVREQLTSIALGA